MYLLKKMLMSYFIIIIVTGCAPAMHSIKIDKEYEKKIQGIVIVEQQNNLTDRYDMLRDRVHKSADALAKMLASNNIKNKPLTLKSLELNQNKKLIEYANEAQVSHVVIIKPTRATVKVHVDYYQLEFIVMDTKTDKVILHSTVNADWYTDTNEIASEVIKGFTANGLL